MGPYDKWVKSMIKGPYDKRVQSPDSSETPTSGVLLLPLVVDLTTYWQSSCAEQRAGSHEPSSHCALLCSDARAALVLLPLCLK